MSVRGAGMFGGRAPDAASTPVPDGYQSRAVDIDQLREAARDDARRQSDMEEQEAYEATLHDLRGARDMYGYDDLD